MKNNRLPSVSLGCTVFSCGWVLMGLEIIGGRMLSPWFGSGVWVWGSVISIFLIALSTGYILGGTCSKRYPTNKALAILITAAGLTFIPVALTYKPVCMFISGWEIHEKWGALISASLLFFIPSTLLGMVSPYAIRLTAVSVETAGSRAGGLYALSTIGSFFGTLFTSFFFILWMSIPQILYLSSAVLLITAAQHVILSQTAGLTVSSSSAVIKLIIISALLGIISGCDHIDETKEIRMDPVFEEMVTTDEGNGLPTDFNEEEKTTDAADFTIFESKVLYEKESLYHYLVVTEDPPYRTLNFRKAGTDYEESTINMDNPIEFAISYYKQLFCAFAHVPKPKNILFLGLGGGTLSMIISHYFPGVHQDAVELDPEVVNCARKYFNFKEHKNLKVYVRDGRVQVRKFIRQKKQYDIIFMDVFKGGSIPYHMTTFEFMNSLKDILAPGGCIAVNLRSGFKSYKFQRRTISKVFENQYIYGVDGNVIIIAENNKIRTDLQDLLDVVDSIHQDKNINFDFPGFFREFYNPNDFIEEGKILTDDYAPADILRGIPDE